MRATSGMQVDAQDAGLLKGCWTDRGLFSFVEPASERIYPFASCSSATVHKEYARAGTSKSLFEGLACIVSPPVKLCIYYISR